MFIRRLTFYLTGLFILSFGVTLTIKADLGAGPWDALNVALSKSFGFTVGSWVIIVGILLILLNAIILKKRPQLLGVIPILLVGFFIDFWLLIVFPHWFPQIVLFRSFFLLLGLVLLAMGIAIYLQSKMVLNPIDHFMVALSERFAVSLGVGKTIAELTALMFAYSFKGPIGIGTIIVTFLVGPFVQLFSPLFNRLMLKWSKTP